MSVSLRHPRTIKDILILLSVLVLGAVAVLTIVFVIRYSFAVNKLSRGIGQTMFYGADGKPWFPLEEHRRDVPLNRISAYLQDAVVAVEDHRFHSHPGVDPIGIGRALYRDLKARGLEEGGSTLTQQLARTLFLSGSRDFTRKGKEAVLALMIEMRLSKTQILELYLNRIYLGGSVYGVEAMSRNVFGKPAADLTLPESAFIAGLIRMPSALSPWSHYDRALKRSHVVLARMREERLITPQVEQAARAAPPRILPSPGLNRNASGYAEDYLRQQFRVEFDADNPPDWKVQSTFVPEMQREAERAISEGLKRFRQAGLQAALVAIDPHSGDVLALVGGRDFHRSPFNRAVNAKRQPGSAFKPFLYAAALNSGLSPISIVSGLNDLRVPGYDEWEVKNASIETRDTLSLREALYESNNQAAVRLQTQIGSRPVLQFAEAAGLPRMPDVPSLALGVGEVTPLQLTTGYAVFPNGGFAIVPRPIVQVLDGDGYAVFNREVQRKPIISEGVAYQMVSMLADVVDTGTGAAARSLGVRFPAAGKTGTTDDFKDAWFVGFSSSVVAGVWVGFDQPASIGRDGYGARYALPIWADFMSRTARIRKPEGFRVPRTVEGIPLCRTSHLVPRDTCPVYTEYFKHADAVPEDKCDVHRGPSPAEVLGSVFSKLGKGIGRIFGR
ncbi:MAG TPA: PBP1A family penicillin-binding protein [Vicinamibacterales bacterium]|nr:PBP1A family penicillin-binding protein [Vicinamibacterales bacterium]